MQVWRLHHTPCNNVAVITLRSMSWYHVYWMMRQCCQNLLKFEGLPLPLSVKALLRDYPRLLLCHDAFSLAKSMRALVIAFGSSGFWCVTLGGFSYPVIKRIPFSDSEMSTASAVWASPGGSCCSWISFWSVLANRAGAACFLQIAIKIWVKISEGPYELECIRILTPVLQRLKQRQGKPWDSPDLIFMKGGRGIWKLLLPSPVYRLGYEAETLWAYLSLSADFSRQLSTCWFR